MPPCRLPPVGRSGSRCCGTRGTGTSAASPKRRGSPSTRRRGWPIGSAPPRSITSTTRRSPRPRRCRCGSGTSVRRRRWRQFGIRRRHAARLTRDAGQAAWLRGSNGGRVAQTRRPTLRRPLRLASGVRMRIVDAHGILVRSSRSARRPLPPPPHEGSTNPPTKSSPASFHPNQHDHSVHRVHRPSPADHDLRLRKPRHPPYPNSTTRPSSSSTSRIAIALCGRRRRLATSSR